MCIHTPRSLALGGLVCFALLAASCSDQAPPLDPTATGALLAGQGQGPQNPQVVILDVDEHWFLEGFCHLYGGVPDGPDLHMHFQGQIRSMLMRHPVTGALRQINVWQGMDVTFTANSKSVTSNAAATEFWQFDGPEDPTQVTVVGLNWNLTAPGWGVILLDAGRYVINWITGELVFEAGPHQGVNGDYDKLCQYFAS